MKTFRLIFVMLCCFSYFSAQRIEVEKLISKFSEKSIEWNIPLSKNENLPIRWYERKSSFYKTENIRTFAGYYNDSFIGVISIQRNEISGSITWEGKAYNIQTHKGFVNIYKDKETLKNCGNCSGNTCDSTHQELGKNKVTSTNLQEVEYEIYSDDILRVYRVALLIDYPIYVRYNRNKELVRGFLARTETFLNEMYMRDLAIKFEMINDDRLIIDSAEKEVHKNRTVQEILHHSTPAINEIIGVENYDIGASITTLTKGQRVGGMAGMYWIHLANNKAYVYSRANESTVAHEFGHMFGSEHTFSEGGEHTMNTEPGYGQSVMGYDLDAPRDFFSLASIFHIRKAFVNNADYFTTPQRNEKVGPGNAGNPVYGIKTNNHPPVIDRSKLENSYTIPKDTYFQFNIKAADPDGHQLVYTAHQTDFRRYQTSNAKFRSVKPSSQNLIKFEPEYHPTALYLMPYSAPKANDIGEYTFWLGVSDGHPANIHENHSTRYDMFPTKVKIVDGVPFKITAGYKKEYSAGEKVTLEWGVDKSIFGENSKVRILLSDDFGKTYKYTLADNIPNSGSYTVTIPPISIGKIQHTNSFSSGKGILKIEVINHIAHTITDNSPFYGGFEVKPSAITFDRLPEATIIVKNGNVPTAETLSATSTCNNSQVKIKMVENTEPHLVTRTWTATDTCNNEISFTQYIYVEKVVEPLKFVGNLPEDINLKCPKDLQTPPEINVTGGTAPNIQFYQSKIQGDYEQYSYLRTWTATDIDAQPISHTQKITIYDNIKPELSDYPQDKVVKTRDEIPNIPYLTATDNCGGNVKVVSSSMWIQENNKLRVEYSWLATDNAGNERTHKQIIRVDPDAPTIQPLKFIGNLPQNKTYACEKEVPQKEDLATSGGCSPSVTFKEEKKGSGCNYQIIRIWTATDTCNNKITHTQTITITDNEKPYFIGNLPQNITITEGQNIPSQENLTAKDNCSDNVTVTPSKEETTKGDDRIITYKWVATDNCGNTNEYQQVITIKKKQIIEKNIVKLLYPNPVEKTFYLKGFKNIQSIKIYNASGRFIKQFAPQNSYDISYLNSGVYIILIKSENSLDKVKIIKH